MRSFAKTAGAIYFAAFFKVIVISNLACSPFSRPGDPRHQHGVSALAIGLSIVPAAARRGRIVHHCAQPLARAVENEVGVLILGIQDDGTLSPSLSIIASNVNVMQLGRFVPVSDLYTVRSVSAYSRRM